MRGPMMILDEAAQALWPMGRAVEIDPPPALAPLSEPAPEPEPEAAPQPEPVPDRIVSPSIQKALSEETHKRARGKHKSSGSYRRVWLFDDVVIKRPVTESWGCDGAEANRSEHAFVERHGTGPFPIEIEGEEEGWTVHFPATALLNDGEVLVMERVNFSHTPRGEDCDSAHAASCKRRMFGHHEECVYTRLLHTLDAFMLDQFDLYDMHRGNFMVDPENRRIYVIDLAQ